MFLEIVSPEATLLKSEVDTVFVPGINGEFQMLDNHAPIVSILGKGEVKFRVKSVSILEQHENRFNKINDLYVLPITSGTIELKANKIIILAD
jgi:F-type H+-transporting ATPase subunit epsilon